MSKENIKWLKSQFSELINNGILTPEIVEKLEAHFNSTESNDKTNWQKTFYTIFGTLGAILIAAGIISILAKNWDYLSKFMQTSIAFIPLILGQIVLGWVFLKRRASIPWCEGSASFLAVSLFCTMSIIGQIYNTSGDFADLIFSWSFLILPIIYLFNTCGAAIFFMVGILSWSINISDQCYYNCNTPLNYTSLWFIPIFSLILPFILKTLNQNALSNKSVLLLWAAPIIFMLFIISHQYMVSDDFIYISILISYFSIIYSLDKIFKTDCLAWQKPLNIIGSLGIFITSCTRSFGYNSFDIRGFTNFTDNRSIVSFIIMSCLIIIASLLAYRCTIMKLPLHETVFCLSPLFALLSYFTLPFFAYNLYLLILGISAIVTGIKTRIMGTANLGLGILSWLIIIRFFDEDIDFLVKGIGFILIGIGFLTTNAVIIKKRRMVG